MMIDGIFMLMVMMVIMKVLRMTQQVIATWEGGNWMVVMIVVNVD